jgi:hypothetical protein
VDFTGEFVANHTDFPYELALAVGWGVALITLAILVALTVAERKSAAGSPPIGETHGYNLGE